VVNLSYDALAIWGNGHDFDRMCALKIQDFQAVLDSKEAKPCFRLN
jgi:hypothetical protein